YSCFLVDQNSSLNRCLYITNALTTVIYTLSLHDALPISEARERRRHARARSTVRRGGLRRRRRARRRGGARRRRRPHGAVALARSEEHTSELQSRENLVCRLLLEQKK